MKATENLLRRSDFFSILSDEDLQKIAPHFESVEYSGGTVILKENTVADCLYVIQNGSVEIWKNFGTEKAARLAVQTTGHIFGEMALIDDEPRSATVLSAEDSSFLYMHKQTFMDLSEKYPSIMLAVLRALSRMIRTSNDSFIKSLSKQNTELQQALDDLRTTQKELIRSERFSNLGKLSSLIIHDLRNPLSVIKGYGEMLQVLNDQPEQVQEYSRKIVQEAERLNQFAEELLDYSRGELRLRWVFTSLPMIFQKVQQYLEKSLQKTNIEFSISHDGNDPFYVDEGRLIRAIVNLCDNARKAMPRGGSLSIYGRVGEKDIAISIQDNGLGMDKDVLAHIFEPFYSSSQGGGTGLGMVSVKTIIEAHKGVVQINSRVNHGTTVSLVIPRAQVLPE